MLPRQPLERTGKLCRVDLPEFVQVTQQPRADCPLDRGSFFGGQCHTHPSFPAASICRRMTQNAHTTNEVPTCEAALQIAMEQTDFTLHGAACLVIGHGRIGALLARKLHALGASVTVSARSARDFARIQADGLRVLDTRRLAGHLGGFPLIFNTVPAPVLGRAELAGLSRGTLLIDLASLPGGVAPDAPLPEGCRLLPALSLPGKVAPRSAARAIYDTVCAILEEELP